jgi:hypothetical protein
MNIIKGLKTEVSLTGLSDQIVKSEVLKKRAFWLIALLLIFVFFCLYNFPYIYGKKTDDSSFYIAARGISSGINIYDQKEFYQLGDEIFGKSVEFWPYLYSPVLAELLVPIAAKSYETFTVVWFILNLIVSFACPVLTFYVLKKKENVNYLLSGFLLCFCLMSIMFRYTLNLGQVNFFVYLMIILSILFYKSNRAFLSSFSLAFAALIKSFPLIYLLYFLLIKDFRYIKHFIFSNIAIIVPSALLFGPKIWIKYLQSILNNLRAQPKTPFYLHYVGHQSNCSVHSMLIQFYSSIGLPVSDVSFIYPIIAVSIFILTLLVLIKAPKNILFSFSLLSVTYLMISPICWRHHYVLIILPLFYVLSLGTIHKPLPSVIAIIASAIIFYYPIWTGFPFNQLILLSTIVLYMLLLLMPGKGQGLIQNKRIQTAI